MTTTITLDILVEQAQEEYQVACPICDMRLILWIVPGMVGKVTTLCTSKTCRKIRVTVDTRDSVVR